MLLSRVEPGVGEGYRERSAWLGSRERVGGFTGRERAALGQPLDRGFRPWTAPARPPS